MKPAALWAAYVASIIGAVVEDFDEKFSALEPTEQAAWAAVATAAGTPEPLV